MKTTACSPICPQVTHVADPSPTGMSVSTGDTRGHSQSHGAAHSPLVPITHRLPFPVGASLPLISSSYPKMWIM